MTDYGTEEELQVAYDWITALPHRVKVIVAGNHDLGLDHRHPSFSQKSFDLFTSEEAKSHGVHYLDRTILTVAQYRHTAMGKVFPIRVYGNPCTPDFLQSNYAFTYLPYPDPSSEPPWNSAPRADEKVDIWVMHSPPLHRLDAIPLPPLTGCEVQRRKIAESGPMLCVFGHYHYSYGAERITWKTRNDDSGEAEISKVERLSSKDQQGDQKTHFDFSQGPDKLLRHEGTVYFNSAWMTMEKTKVDRRNPPWLVTLDLS